MSLGLKLWQLLLLRRFCRGAAARIIIGMAQAAAAACEQQQHQHSLQTAQPQAPEASMQFGSMSTGPNTGAPITTMSAASPPLPSLSTYSSTTTTAPAAVSEPQHEAAALPRFVGVELDATAAAAAAAAVASLPGKEKLAIAA